MNITYIEALGYLLQTYRSDLTSLNAFQSSKTSGSDYNGYLKIFNSYLHKSGVARNVAKGKTDFLLQLTKQWVDQSHADNVDQFAELLKDRDITRGKVMTSLASKILYLNNPWTIIPIDNIAKKTFGLKTNLYSDYTPFILKFKSDNEVEIQRILDTVDEHLSLIEAGFKETISDLQSIRTNRFVDKLIYTIGTW